jgi:hypothetical protein
MSNALSIAFFEFGPTAGKSIFEALNHVMDVRESQKWSQSVERAAGVCRKILNSHQKQKEEVRTRLSI